MPASMPIRAILWDNDGVLVDTERLYYQATREVMASVGVELTEAMYVQLFLVEGRGAFHLAEEKGLAPAEVAALRERRNRQYKELLERQSRPIAGVGEALRALRPHFRMAVVTSSHADHFAAAHQRTGLLPLFEFALTRECYGRSKPDPEPYLRAVERLGLSKGECLAVEDSERGLRAAKAAGIACWVIPHGLSRHGSFGGADRVFGDIAEVARALLASG
jgi:HAD superfamily hydrolase (TIGR01509 family)